MQSSLYGMVQFNRTTSQMVNDPTSNQQKTAYNSNKKTEQILQSKLINHPENQSISQPISKTIKQNLTHQPSSQSIQIQKQYFPLEKQKQENLADGSKHQKNNSTFDAQLKQSGKTRNRQNANQRGVQQSMLNSIQLQQSIRKTVTSTILAHYRLNSNNQIQKIDNVYEKKNSIKNSIEKQRQKHWNQVQIPQDIFNDDQSQIKSHQSEKKIIKVTFGNQTPQLNQYQVNPHNTSSNPINSMNPMSFMPDAIQKSMVNPFQSWHPQPQQSPNNGGVYQNNNTFLHPNMTNMSNNSFPQQNSQMQFSHTANFVPPLQMSCTSANQPCWQFQNMPPQQFCTSHYSPQSMSQVRYLRQQIRMLRDLMKQQRTDKYQERVRRGSESYSQRQCKQTQSSYKLQLTCIQLRQLLQSQRKQHQKEMKNLEQRFKKQIHKLKQQQSAIKQQNRSLKRRQSFAKSQIKQHKYLNTDFNIKTDRSSARKKSQLDSHPSSRISQQEQLIKTKINLNKKREPSKNKNKKKEQEPKNTKNRICISTFK